ncbi:MAG: hypothetical protein QNK20_11370 [Aureibaculum sp.]|nr:hypothetical protein [Aureibaculum sp.]
MKHFYLLLISLTVLSCGSTQTATNQIQSGNYADAFNTSVAQLNKDKSKKSNQKLIPLLKEAYTKGAKAGLDEIKLLEKKKTPESFKKVYGNYLNLDIRQDEVRALQPLYYEGNEVTFKFADYTNEIKTSKNKYSTSLYSNAVTALKGDQLDARNAYKYLEDLNYVDPTFKNNLNDLLQKAKNKGSSFVVVYLKNNVKNVSNDSIKDLPIINSANFGNQWVIYHSKKQRNVNYNYQVDITLDKLTFEPEKTLQETVQQEGKVQDGYQYQLDNNGNVMKDDKGNDIKVAKFKVVKAEVALYQQNKSSKLDGKIIIKDLIKRTTLSTNPTFGEAKFQHLYAKYRGDQRAIEQEYYDALNAKEVPYPKDFEFIKYSIRDFKIKLTGLMSQQQF